MYNLGNPINVSFLFNFFFCSWHSFVTSIGQITPILVVWNFWFPHVYKIILQLSLLKIYYFAAKMFHYAINDVDWNSNKQGGISRVRSLAAKKFCSCSSSACGLILLKNNSLSALHTPSTLPTSRKESVSPPLQTNINEYEVIFTLRSRSFRFGFKYYIVSYQSVSNFRPVELALYSFDRVHLSFPGYGIWQFAFR